jgi:hypothetical protein
MPQRPRDHFPRVCEYVINSTSGQNLIANEVIVAIKKENNYLLNILVTKRNEQILLKICP